MNEASESSTQSQGISSRRCLGGPVPAPAHSRQGCELCSAASAAAVGGEGAGGEVLREGKEKGRTALGRGKGLTPTAKHTARALPERGRSWAWTDKGTETGGARTGGEG